MNNHINQARSEESRKPSFIEATLLELKDIMKSSRDFNSLYRDVQAYVELKLKESFKNGLASGMKKAEAEKENGGGVRKFSWKKYHHSNQ